MALIPYAGGRRKPKYVGVCKCRDKFQARIYCGNYKRRHLGTFPTLEEAARAYDVAALAKYGASAPRLNFPGEARQ